MSIIKMMNLIALLLSILSHLLILHFILKKKTLVYYNWKNLKNELKHHLWAHVLKATRST